MNAHLIERRGMQLAKYYGKYMKALKWTSREALFSSVTGQDLFFIVVREGAESILPTENTLTNQSRPYGP
jgi:hypothetical protein